MIFYTVSRERQESHRTKAIVEFQGKIFEVHATTQCQEASWANNEHRARIAARDEFPDLQEMQRQRYTEAHLIGIKESVKSALYTQMQIVSSGTSRIADLSEDERKAWEDSNPESP